MKKLCTHPCCWKENKPDESQTTSHTTNASYVERLNKANGLTKLFFQMSDPDLTLNPCNLGDHLILMQHCCSFFVMQTTHYLYTATARKCFHPTTTANQAATEKRACCFKDIVKYEKRLHNAPFRSKLQYDVYCYMTFRSLANMFTVL